MHFSHARGLLVLAALSLAACGQNIDRMSSVATAPGGMPARLQGAIAVGDVSGGSSVVSPSGVTNGEFTQVLERVLRDNDLLAPSADAARYRLDAMLNLALVDTASVDDRVDATVTYRLFERAQASPALERTIKTSFVQPAPDAGTEVGIFLLGGIGGLIGEARTRESLGYEGTVRRNVQQFLYALAAFGTGEAGPAIAAEAPAATLSAPVKQPAAADPLATAAKPTPAAPKPFATSDKPPPARQTAELPPPASPATPPAPARDPILFGDQVAFRCPAAGTEIEFRSGLTRIFAPPAEGTLDCPYRNGSGTTETTIFGQYDAKAEAALQGLWPLRVGNAVSFVNGGSMERLYNETYRVARHERITVPAGTFDTFVIDWDASSNNIYAQAYHETASFWYAPAVGFVVKVEHHLVGGLYARVVDDEAVRVIAQ